MQQPGPDAAPNNALAMIPSLVVRDAAAAAAFYVAAFGAVEEARHEAAAGQSETIGPATFRLALGSTRILLVGADRAGLLGPESYGGAPVHFTVVAQDAAAMRARALAHGAVALAAAEGWLRDPFLHLWRIVPANPPAAAGRTKKAQP